MILGRTRHSYQPGWYSMKLGYNHSLGWIISTAPPPILNDNDHYKTYRMFVPSLSDASMVAAYYPGSYFDPPSTTVEPSVRKHKTIRKVVMPGKHAQRPVISHPSCSHCLPDRKFQRNFPSTPVTLLEIHTSPSQFKLRYPHRYGWRPHCRCRWTRSRPR